MIWNLNLNRSSVIHLWISLKTHISSWFWTWSTLLIDSCFVYEVWWMACMLCHAAPSGRRNFRKFLLLHQLRVEMKGCLTRVEWMLVKLLKRSLNFYLIQVMLHFLVLFLNNCSIDVAFWKQYDDFVTLSNHRICSTNFITLDRI
jgi:hypothetical protein